MLYFLDKMFHTEGMRLRLSPYVILEGRSPDRNQSIKRGLSQGQFSFLYDGDEKSLTFD